MGRKCSVGGWRVWPTPRPARGPGPTAGSRSSEKLLWVTELRLHPRVWAGSVGFQSLRLRQPGIDQNKSVITPGAKIFNEQRANQVFIGLRGIIFLNKIRC